MIKTFLINLDRDTERLAHMKALLERLQIEYTRFSAIYGKDIDAYAFVDEVKMLKTERRQLSPGDIGTALSHRGVYDLVLEGKLDYALILEDDVSLPYNFREIVEREVRKDTDWEYLAFDYGPMGFELFSIWFRSFVPRLNRTSSGLEKFGIILYGIIKFFYIAPLFLFEITRDRLRCHWPGPVKFYRPMYNAGAYIVSLEGARKLRELATPIYCTSDRLHNQARVLKGLKVRWYAPAIARQVREEFGSSASEQTAKQYQDKTAYVK